MKGEKMQKDFFKELFRPENKKIRGNVLLAFLMGILLLTSGSIFSKERKPIAESGAAVQKETMQEQKTEQRMAEVLSKIEGAGQVDVMLTYRKTEEKKVAQQEVREERRNTESGEENLRTETEIVLLEEGKGNTEPLILSSDAAKAEGVVIVAQGGADPEVCAALNHAAQALLDVPAHKIAVLKMK